MVNWLPKTTKNQVTKMGWKAHKAQREIKLLSNVFVRTICWTLTINCVPMAIHLIFCSNLRFANQLVDASLSGRRQLIRQLDRTHACTVGPIEKNPPKMRLKKIWEIYWSYLSLPQFDRYSILWSTSSDWKWKSNLLKFTWKNWLNHKIMWI